MLAMIPSLLVSLSLKATVIHLSHLLFFFPQLLSCLFQLLFLYDASFGPSCHYSSIPPDTAPFHFSISLQQFWSGPFLLCPVPGISLAPFCFGNITAQKLFLLLLFLNLR